MSLRVREAQSTDLPVLASLWVQMAHDAGYRDPDREGWILEMDRLLTSGLGVCVMAVVQGDGLAVTVGFVDAVLSYEPATRKTLGIGRTIFVDEGCRGQGVGEKMATKLGRLLADRGATSIMTHGTITQRVFEKVFGRRAEDRFTFRELRI